MIAISISLKTIQFLTAVMKKKGEEGMRNISDIFLFNQSYYSLSKLFFSKKRMMLQLYAFKSTCVWKMEILTFLKNILFEIRLCLNVVFFRKIIFFRICLVFVISFFFNYNNFFLSISSKYYFIPRSQLKYSGNTSMLFEKAI